VFFYLIEQHSKLLLHTLQVTLRISRSIGTTTYSYLKRIVYDKLLKPRQSFRIILYLRNKDQHDALFFLNLFQL